jgi:hypothetical protein
MQRRTILQAMMLFGAMPGLAFAKPETIEVYKSATCGCCTEWVEHLRKNGFEVKTQNVPNTAAYRARFGIPAALGSCHTATIGGYALEGHVPAKEIRRLLAEKPKAVGLTVPGMPMGSPGMEMPDMPADAYDVLLVRKDGSHVVYQHYKAQQVVR